MTAERSITDQPEITDGPPPGGESCDFCGIVSGRMPRTSPPEAAPAATTMTWPWTWGVTRRTPGSAASRSVSAP